MIQYLSHSLVMKVITPKNNMLRIAHFVFSNLFKRNLYGFHSSRKPTVWFIDRNLLAICTNRAKSFH